MVPSTSRITEGDHALVDAMSHANPMDISGEAGDAYSRTFGQVEDIDAEDTGNPQPVSVYVNSIYSYMWQLESKYKIGPKFLEGSELTGKMRAILVDWLCQVHNRFHLLQETLYLTVAIIDRYLQVRYILVGRMLEFNVVLHFTSDLGLNLRLKPLRPVG